ncbi:hypothetical protein QBC38DRAFT_378479 [Podospora fimiseda]|uniref:Uncharacterized protein n=1 Tax=Podospora fimiseda TaxID=252190 RepID=A0AAN7BE80_9PEZI|nr:hypothetical protein QBC38DRAFT_378479 [Podospora fimiseda]
METIHEMSPRSQTMPSPGAEALMFTVRSSQEASGNMMGPAPMVRHGRSASMKSLPATRKPSFRVRGWVKRSNTSGTVPVETTYTSTSNSSNRLKITHLGGGRIEEADSPTRRPQKQGRDHSVDSRRTQWLDFYTEDPVSGSTAPEETQQSEQTTKPSPNPDFELRPLPLHVPLLEKKEDAKPELTRKKSLWKALPSLPVQQQSVSTSRDTSTLVDVEHLMGKIILDEVAGIPPIAELEAIPRPPTDVVSRKNPKIPVPLSDEYGTPPPTPDSEAGGAARQSTVTITKAPPETNAQNLEPRKFSFQKTKAPQHSLVHTRQERVWLHTNYRGEAPFLEAWGLDISRQRDREEGLMILRELMLEEASR